MRVGIPDCPRTAAALVVVPGAGAVTLEALELAEALPVEVDADAVGVVGAKLPEVGHELVDLGDCVHQEPSEQDAPF